MIGKRHRIGLRNTIDSNVTINTSLAIGSRRFTRRFWIYSLVSLKLSYLLNFLHINYINKLGLNNYRVNWIRVLQARIFMEDIDLILGEILVNYYMGLIDKLSLAFS